MGADLYIHGKHDEWHNQYVQAFNDAVAKRDNEPSEAEKQRIQEEEVSPAYEKLYGENPYYFRDSYNNSSILWMLELSWWRDSEKFLTKNGYMSPAKAVKWLELIKSREETMKANIEGRIVAGTGYADTEEQVQEAKKYYYDKYQRLIEFFERAIELKAKVDFSI